MNCFLTLANYVSVTRKFWTPDEKDASEKTVFGLPFWHNTARERRDRKEAGRRKYLAR